MGIWADGRARTMAPAALAVATAVCACGASAAGEARGVVELFTSQGCSSCPPADAVLGEIARDPDVVALSFSVDYWDYLGWQDTFARPDFTRRQKAYAEGRGDRAIYTPQVVVNGRSHMVGSDKTAILAALDEGGDEALSVDVDARLEGDRVVVNVAAGAKPATGRAAVWIAGYRQPETVEIGRGENAGHEITYTNVVERWQVLGMWDGDEMTVELPVADIASDRTAGLAVILQTKTGKMPGPILGAAKVDLATN